MNSGQHDAGERRVQSARVDACPQRDAQEGVRQRAVDAPSVEQRQQHGDRRGAREVVPVQRARVEQRDDDDRADVVDDRRSGEKDAKLDRHPLAEHHDQRDRERGVGGHRHTPAVAPLARRNHQRVERCRHRHPADRGSHGKRRRARLREPPDRELALDLEPHQQEEDREERIVHPVPQRHPEPGVRELETKRRFPERGEFGAQR